MLGEFPVLPTAISVGLGAADGLVASYDVDKWATDPANVAKVPGAAPPLWSPFGKSKALLLQLAAMGIGLVGEFADWHPDISEPLLGVGSALTSRSVAFHFAQQGQKVPVAAQGMRAHVAAPSRAAGLSAPGGVPYMQQSAVGVL